MTLRVAIVGCGKIAEQHVLAVKRLAGATLVGTCDTEPLMAKQLAERHGIACATGSLGELLSVARPDVVHITTPPASHFDVARQCMRAGCHVYVEKPFTVDATEARELFAQARANDVCITAGHNLQYTWESLEARGLIKKQFLGGAPVHIESYYTYNFGDAQYAKALLGDSNHWVRRLPGQLLHNIISHGIARIAEFLDCDDPHVQAFGHRSPLLQSIGETEVVDELRVHISDRRNTTGYFVFSSQLSPAVNGARYYGPVNSLVVDNVHHTLTRFQRRGYKSYLNYFLPPVLEASQQLANARRNVGRFLRTEFHDDSGLKNCIESFYRAVGGEVRSSMTEREVVMTALIMDRIFTQLRAAERAPVPCAPAMQP